MESNPRKDGDHADSERKIAGGAVSSDARLLTKEDLRQALNLPSTRSVDELVRRRVISSIRMGWRTVRFNLATVLRDLEKVTIRAV
jgi:hypothetical protein